jgi:hypothetical protein
VRFFDEENGNPNKAPTETLVLMSIKDAQVFYEALDEYTKNNPRKKKAKELMKELDKKWGIF